VDVDESPSAITTGFRPLLTKEGASSSIFRFFADRAQNEKYMTEGMQPIFWYCKNVMAKPGVGEVYATHPSDSGPDGRKAPLLVLGRYGAGRTLFSAIDDSWRWRFYTGEGVFDTYWVQQIRYLARSKKLGQRPHHLHIPSSDLPARRAGPRHAADHGPQLIQQLPEQIRVEITDANGQIIRHETLIRQEGQPELYVGSFTADQVGNFTVKLPSVAGQVEAQELPVTVAVPSWNWLSRRSIGPFLTRLASETLGRVVDLDQAPRCFQP